MKAGSEGRVPQGQKALSDRGEGLSDSHAGQPAKPVTQVSQIKEEEKLDHGARGAAL